MVEVTRSNFNEIFPSVEQSIKNASFIAIDTEFTGLHLGPSNDNNLFDNLRERYTKLLCRAVSFIPCQIGLSTFTKCLNENSYSVETFVFYIRPCMVGSIDRIFMCQASALDFLSGYNFDFNKFIQEGIPYLNENEEIQVRQKLEDGTICLPHEKLQDPRHQVKLNDVIDRTFKKTKNKPDISKERITLPIDRRSHVYFQLNEIRRKFPKCWAYVENDLIVIKAVSPEERKKLEECKAEEQEKVLDYFLGFTKVFRLLKKCQKPIVGHNLLMDLMLLYHNFHQNLPATYDKFKKELHSVFPVIYDTKHIWLNIREVQEFKRFAANSALTALYELLKSPPDYLNTLYSPGILPSNCQKYVVGDFVHDSGYDAFITGYVFLKICHTFKQHLDAISPFVNKVNFSYFQLKYINLDGADPEPQQPGYLYISPKTWTRTLTREELLMRFSKHHTLEFKFIKGRRAALAVVQNVYMYNRILKEFKDDPDIIVEK
ncbi:Poly(A)-specific ribonuclease PNLDC1 like protein [Argiope bruennichi]|uniref:Poly(A)-specific ribonuclease PNLDC1 like protein n=1 Tax=Argiope bruennichi TaxID=94029 RepID=A0A8T0ED26_ARGBR|nr:Poly(A)-specific ribonuclease PNLDC1 like protein [Argiope bruennichi]